MMPHLTDANVNHPRKQDEKELDNGTSLQILIEPCVHMSRNAREKNTGLPVHNEVYSEQKCEDSGSMPLRPIVISNFPRDPLAEPIKFADNFGVIQKVKPADKLRSTSEALTNRSYTKDVANNLGTTLSTGQQLFNFHNFYWLSRGIEENSKTDQRFSNTDSKPLSTIAHLADTETSLMKSPIRSPSHTHSAAACDCRSQCITCIHKWLKKESLGKNESSLPHQQQQQQHQKPIAVSGITESKILLIYDDAIDADIDHERDEYASSFCQWITVYSAATILGFFCLCFLVLGCHSIYIIIGKRHTHSPLWNSFLVHGTFTLGYGFFLWAAFLAVVALSLFAWAKNMRPENNFPNQQKKLAKKDSLLTTPNLLVTEYAANGTPEKKLRLNELGSIHSTLLGSTNSSTSKTRQISVPVVTVVI